MVYDGRTKPESSGKQYYCCPFVDKSMEQLQFAWFNRRVPDVTSSRDSADSISLSEK